MWLEVRVMRGAMGLRQVSRRSDGAARRNDIVGRARRGPTDQTVKYDSASDHRLSEGLNRSTLLFH